jgi:hypothetical protein
MEMSNQLDPYDKILIDRELLRCANSLMAIMRERNIKMSSKGFTYGKSNSDKDK